MNRAPVEIDDRKAIPKSWKDASRARSGGTCAYPECEVATGLEYDHILAIKLGGKHRPDNIQPLCHGHHRQKTNLDIKMIAKAKAQGGETGQFARRQKRGGSSIPARVNGWPPAGSRKVSSKKAQRVNQAPVPGDEEGGTA